MTEPMGPAEEAQPERRERSAALRHLTKTDPDPRVRRRAQALLLVEEGHSQARAARLLHTSAYLRLSGPCLAGPLWTALPRKAARG